MYLSGVPLVKSTLVLSFSDISISRGVWKEDPLLEFSSASANESESVCKIMEQRAGRVAFSSRGWKKSPLILFYRVDMICIYVLLGLTHNRGALQNRI